MRREAGLRPWIGLRSSAYRLPANGLHSGRTALCGPYRPHFCTLRPVYVPPLALPVHIYKCSRSQKTARSEFFLFRMQYFALPDVLRAKGNIKYGKYEKIGLFLIAAMAVFAFTSCNDDTDGDYPRYTPLITTVHTIGGEEGEASADYYFQRTTARNSTRATNPASRTTRARSVSARSSGSTS